MEDMPEKEPAQPARQPASQSADGASEGFSPRVKEVFQRIMAATMKALYSDPRVAQSIIDMMRSGDPAVGIVHGALQILSQMRSKIRGINPNVVYKCAPIVALLVAELGVRAGVVPDDMTKVAPRVIALLKQALSSAQGQGQPPAQPQPQAQAQPQPGAGSAQPPQGIVAQQMGG